MFYSWDPICLCLLETHTRVPRKAAFWAAGSHVGPMERGQLQLEQDEAHNLPYTSGHKMAKFCLTQGQRHAVGSPFLPNLECFPVIFWGKRREGTWQYQIPALTRQGSSYLERNYSLLLWYFWHKTSLQLGFMSFSLLCLPCVQQVKCWCCLPSAPGIHGLPIGQQPAGPAGQGIVCASVQLWVTQQGEAWVIFVIPAACSSFACQEHLGLSCLATSVTRNIYRYCVRYHIYMLLSKNIK